MDLTVQKVCTPVRFLKYLSLRLAVARIELSGNSVKSSASIKNRLIQYKTVCFNKKPSASIQNLLLQYKTVCFDTKNRLLHYKTVCLKTKPSASIQNRLVQYKTVCLNTKRPQKSTKRAEVKLFA